MNQNAIMFAFYYNQKYCAHGYCFSKNNVSRQCGPGNDPQNNEVSVIILHLYRNRISGRPLHCWSRSLSALRSACPVSLNNSDRQAIGSRKCIFSRRRALCHAFAPATLYMTIAMSLGRASRLSAASLLPPPPISRRLSPCPVPYPLSDILPKKKENLLNFILFICTFVKRKYSSVPT